MAQVTPGSSSTQTREMIGAALGMLATFTAAMFFAFFLPRLAFYVTFLMPVLVGFLLSAVGAIGPRRFGFGNPKALVLFMVGGSLVAWAGHHVFAYLRVVDGLNAQLALALSRPDDGFAELEQLVRTINEGGFGAYLEFVSSGPAGETYSPVGLLGKAELGAWGTAIVAIVELVLMAGTASWTILFRTRALREELEARPLAYVEGDALAAAMRLVEERRFEAAGAALAGAEGEPSHVLMLRDGDVTTELSVFALDASGRPGARVAVKLVSREAGAELRRGFSAGGRARTQPGGGAA